MTVLIPNLAIAGYRSFGKSPQYFERFAKINLLIGRNNAGKSNVIRFLSEVYPQSTIKEIFQFSSLARHLPDSPPMLLGIGHNPDENDNLGRSGAKGYVLSDSLSNPHHRPEVDAILKKIFSEKRRLDNAGLCWTLQTLPDRSYNYDLWIKAMQVISDKDANFLWRTFTNMSGGDRQHHWEPDIIKRLPQSFPDIVVQVIPAIRQIGMKGSLSNGFDGNGIIERLAKLQNPDAHNQRDRLQFEKITKFLRVVIDDPLANIEIPYERDTILVHMDNKVLPIESLGSGIHEVIILAAAATVLEGNVVCIEEPELHLNPVLQRKLIRYLSTSTCNQYFLSTHSAALMDNEGVEIYHVKLDEKTSVVERVTSDHKRSLVCEDLGYHPSDLLQANCVIWVEGPSDRIYLNYWLRYLSEELVEGIHYSIMFYGGRLASHLSHADYSKEVTDFISLRRLNRRGVIILDSDREKPLSRINPTKIRLQQEFNSGPGHCWITQGREIENYLPPTHVSAAVAAICPKAALMTSLGKNDNCLKIKGKNGKETQAPKVEIAKNIIATNQPDLTVLDLKQRLNELLIFIQESNPQAPRPLAA